MPTILVVDDDASVSRSIQRVLKTQYDVVIAHNGKEALDLILAGPKVDLVITDWDMPELTGPELIDALALAGDRTPVILMSGNFNMEGRREPVGEFARFEKPFAIDAMRELIRKAIGPGVIITPPPTLDP